MQNAEYLPVAKRRPATAQIFAASFLAFAALAAALIGSFPLQLSIITIFLFAGVHNALEFRYFLARMPVRWGKSKVFYSCGIGGVVFLTAAYLTIYFAFDDWLWNLSDVQVFASAWNICFVLWIGALFYLRGRQKPRSDWSLAFAAAFFAAAVVWLFPQYFGLSLVYLHPLIAMWFLERQIRRTRREWLKSYRFCLASVPVFIAVLYFASAAAPNLPDETDLFRRIVQHAGSGILPNVSSRFLVAAHVFLETIHYAVWILLIPLADRRAVPWRFGEIPLFAHRHGVPKLVSIALGVCLLAVVVLWLGFSIDYPVTRDVYFAFAVAHVLAEFPFLIKML